MSLSSRLQSMRFMQRAKAKDDVKKKEDEAPQDDSHWVAPVRENDGGAECLVVVENDPKPGALLGRMSFSKYNPSIEKLSEDAEESAARREGRGDAALHSKKEASVSAAEMAESLARTETKKEPGTSRSTTQVVKSVRVEGSRNERTVPPSKRQKLGGSGKHQRT